MRYEITNPGSPFEDPELEKRRQMTTTNILGRITEFDPETDGKAIADAVELLRMKTGVCVALYDEGVLVAVTRPPAPEPRSRSARHPDDKYPDYPTDRYVGTREMQQLLRKHGVKVSRRELEEKGGACWDGGPDDHKWYEALEYYGVEYPDGALDFSRLDLYRPEDRTTRTASGLYVYTGAATEYLFNRERERWS